MTINTTKQSLEQMQKSVHNLKERMYALAKRVYATQLNIARATAQGWLVLLDTTDEHRYHCVGIFPVSQADDALHEGGGVWWYVDQDGETLCLRYITGDIYRDTTKNGYVSLRVGEAVQFCTESEMLDYLTAGYFADWEEALRFARKHKRRARRHRQTLRRFGYE